MGTNTQYQGKWLNLCEATFTNSKGEQRAWEYASRTGNTQAAYIIARIQASPERLVLVKQLRPPVGKPVLEFPAGLIDVGENTEQAALRELREETGFIGEVISTGPAVFSSPGLTDESVSMVEVKVTSRSAQRLESDEDIEVIEVALPDLKTYLLEASSQGIAIDAKLWNFAQGLSFKS